MSNKTSVYDKENFFALYQKLRSNPISLNEIVEKPTMLSLLPDLQGKKLLDLGCGTGGHLQLYLERNAESVVGTDLSAKMLEQAEQDLQKCGQIFRTFFVISVPMEKLTDCQKVILISLPALLLFIILKIFPLY